MQEQQNSINWPQVPVIIGPTGVGKTGLAIEIAKDLPVEIVSMDSVMIYRGLDIGSAKPTMQERQGIVHHLIDVADIEHPWSVGDYLRALGDLLPTIYQRKRLPLLVGGTMLYYRTITQGLSELPVSEPATYQYLQAEQNDVGLLKQYERLRDLDPDTAARIESQDKQRIHRALAVYHQTGCTLTKWHQLNPPHILPYHFCTVVINDDIAVIRQRIQLRFLEMFQQGWLEEVEKLYAYYHNFKPIPYPLHSIGYHQIWDYCAGNITYDKMMERIPIVTGQLAKRQQTWLRSWPTLPRYSVSDSFTLQQLKKWLADCCATSLA